MYWRSPGVRRISGAGAFTLGIALVQLGISAPMSAGTCCRSHRSIESWRAMAQFMLIHGAGHGAWCWDYVVEALERRGHTALATDQPGLGRDTTKTEEITWQSTLSKLSAELVQLPGDVILVGHSMGGTLTAQLTEMHPTRVAAAVYLAATLPGGGESCLSSSQEDSSAARLFFACDELGIDPEVALNLYPMLLFGDCADEVARESMSNLRPQPMSVFSGSVSLTPEREGSVPRYYIETLRDLVITPAHQREMVSRRSCERVFTLTTGHSPMLAAPEDVADILDEIAQSLPSSTRS